MSLFGKVFRVVSFNAFQTIFSKGIAFINFAILIRLLSGEDIGVIGLSAGYVALMGFLLVLPESIFIRDFLEIRKRLNEYISAFLGFNAVRGLVLFLFAIPVAFWLSQIQLNPELGSYFLLLVLATLLNTLSGPFREAFYSNYRQARIAFVDLSLNVVSLLVLVALFFSRSVVTYGWLQVLVALIGVGWWYWNARKAIHFRFQWHLRWFGMATDAIKGFAIWNHLAGAMMRLVYQADVVILGFFVSLAALGDYTVALTLANVFFVFPQMIQKVMSLSFSQMEKKETVSPVLGVVVRYNTILSLAQFVGYAVVGPWLIALLSPDNPGTVFLYSLYLAGGVTLLNITRPWISLAVVRIPPKRFFTMLFLGPCLLAIGIYWAAANYYGIVGVAQANILTYFIVGVWGVLYTTHSLRILPRLFYPAEFEKRLIHRLSQSR